MRRNAISDRDIAPADYVQTAPRDGSFGNAPRHTRRFGVARQKAHRDAVLASHELTGARLLGMTAVRLDAPDLGAHLTFDADVDWTGPVVDSLDDVPSLGAPTLV